MAEAIACLGGLKLVINLTHGHGDLLFETDCNSLLKVLLPWISIQITNKYHSKGVSFAET
jgi:hypothetical protein